VEYLLAIFSGEPRRPVHSKYINQFSSASSRNSTIGVGTWGERGLGGDWGHMPHAPPKSKSLFYASGDLLYSFYTTCKFMMCMIWERYG